MYHFEGSNNVFAKLAKFITFSKNDSVWMPGQSSGKIHPSLLLKIGALK